MNGCPIQAVLWLEWDSNNPPPEFRILHTCPQYPAPSNSATFPSCTAASPHCGKSRPNVAGKSTLLRVIAGLIRPTYGTLAVLGATQSGAVRSRLGYLGHDSMLYDCLLYTSPSPRDRQKSRMP